MKARSLWQVLAGFHHASSWRLPVVLLLMLLQSVTAGIGLLFIIPLLQLIGLDTGAEGTGAKPDSGIASFANTFFDFIGVTPGLLGILCSYIILVALIASMHYALSVLSVSTTQHYICRLRSTLYSGLLQTQWQFILSRKLSGFIHSLTIQVQSMGQAARLLLNLASQLVLTVILIVLAFLLSWQMSLLAMVFAGILLLSLLPLNKLIYATGHGETIRYKDIFQLMTEQLASLKMIKSFASEAHHAGQVQRAGEDVAAHVVRFTRMHALTQWVYMVGAVIGFSVFFYVAQTHLQVSLATTLLLLIIFSRLLPQIARIQRTYQQLLHYTAAIQELTELQAACDRHKEAEWRTGTQPPVLERCITIDGIDYAYPERGKLFQGFSAVIPRNQTVALVGPSGAGKSTLADLVAGLLAPQAGTLYCDDTPLTGETRVAWRKSIAYVTQEVFLFHDTVRANLSWVADDPTEEAIWSALKLAAADEFVAALPHGLETVIGDRGVRLSGGERQRLALARAILSKPQLLILDEATSALDNTNERLIQKALQQLHGKLTLLIIAHRETTIQHADARIVLPQCLLVPSEKSGTSSPLINAENGQPSRRAGGQGE